MKCPHCNQNIESIDEFCPYCGMFIHQREGHILSTISISKKQVITVILIDIICLILSLTALPVALFLARAGINNPFLFFYLLLSLSLIPIFTMKREYKKIRILLVMYYASRIVVLINVLLAIYVNIT